MLFLHQCTFLWIEARATSAEIGASGVPGPEMLLATTSPDVGGPAFEGKRCADALEAKRVASSEPVGGCHPRF